MVTILATSAEDAGEQLSDVSGDAFEGLVVSVDGKTSALQVGVEFLVAVDNSKQFPFDVCVS